MKALGLGIMIIFLVVAVALLAIVISRVKETRKYKRETILFFLVTGLVIGMTGLVALAGMPGQMSLVYILLQLFVLVMGILNAWLLYRLLPWTVKSRFTWEFLFTLATVFLGVIVMLLVFKFVVKLVDLKYILLTALVWYFVPFLFMQAYHRYLAIPEKIFRKWYFPVGKEIADPLDSELVSLLVVSFIFKKKIDDSELTSFRAKAPQHMVFGRLFYYFINDYNERHPESPIEYIHGDNQPYGWVFYLRPEWLGGKRYIDPDQVIGDNRIKENSIIVCQRYKDK